MQQEATEPMTIPGDLLVGIADQSGRITLVVGAGCSVEPPTNLLTAKDYSIRAHAELRASDVLGDDADNPEDLSSVADAVVKSTGSQVRLVEQLPIENFRGALPNDGYLIAAAMMREGVISSFVTLNFDTAMSKALADLGASEVSILKGPEEHHRLGPINLIYLHRNVEANAEDWVLTGEALDESWKDNWEEIIANRALSSPVVVFAGLGSPAAVLVHSVEKVRSSIPKGEAAIYQVGTSEFGESAFADALDIEEDNYVKLSWVDFMRSASERLVSKKIDELKTACDGMIESLGLDGVNDDSISSICDNVGELGLVGIGRFRAHCFLHPRAYCKASQERTNWIADLLLALALLKDHMGMQLRIDASGLVLIYEGEIVIASLFIVHARSMMGWIKLDHRVRVKCLELAAGPLRPRLALVSGVYGDRPDEISPPAHIGVGATGESIADPTAAFDILTVDDLRSEPSIVEDVIA